MQEKDFNIKIDDNRMSLVLLQVIKKKNLINEPTFKAVLEIYYKKLREVA